jgi:hypothetical protein
MYRRKMVKERSSEKSRGDIVQNILTPCFPCLSDTTSLGSALPSCSQATEHLSVAMPVFQKTVKTAIRTFGYQVREGPSRLRRNGAHNFRSSSYPFGGGKGGDEVVRRRRRAGCWNSIDPFEPCLSRSSEKCARFLSCYLSKEAGTAAVNWWRVGVCLDPAHLLGPWTCDMRGLMYFPIY